MSADWRPAASMEALKGRARLLDRLRAWMGAEGFLEVETPLLSRAGSPELHLDSLHVPGAFPDGAPGWLGTSPEFHLKRLLAAGAGSIYSVSRVFRAGEAGRLHNPEFTLVEWYRAGGAYPRLMSDIERLLTALLPSRLLAAAPERITYREAFMRHAGLDPFAAAAEDLRRRCGAEGGQDRDALLDRIAGFEVYPKLGQGRISLIHDFPASQASLARIRPGEPDVAERVEAIVGGVELVNGFVELVDAEEQRRRFEADRAARREQGRNCPELDERFLAALEAGLPACAGAAMGFDRLAMLALGLSSLAEVQAFPEDRA
ncbi:MAG TPA: EF-P lysine aminoacylase EpmA [Gammaproteobacteria bacterium]|nr:EF-P lysine aminoacylase EpmA [Gammaproteobacteria bacterium]